MAIDTSQPAIFGLRNHAAGATITPSQEAAGYDGDNLKVPSYSGGATAGANGTWRSTGVGSSVNLDFDFGALKSDIEAIALFGFNGTDAATRRILGDNNAGFPSPEHDSGTASAFDTSRSPAAGLDDTPPWGRPLIYLPASTWSARYVRITLTDTANPAGFLEAAYAVIGPALQLGQAVTFAPRVEWLGGAGIAVARMVQTLGFLRVSEAVRRQAQSLSRALRQDGRFGLVPRPYDPASWPAAAALYRLLAPIDEEPVAGTDEWNLTLQAQEVVD